MRDMRLHLVFEMLRYAHIIDYEAGYADVAGIERAGFRDALHAGDDNAAVCLRRHGEIERLAGHALMLVGEVSVSIGRSAAQQRHVHLGQRIEEVFLSAEIRNIENELLAFLLRLFVDHAAVFSRIHERSEAHLREKSREAAALFSPDLAHHPERIIICQYLVVHNLRRDLERAAYVTVYAASEKAIVGQRALAAAHLALGIHAGKVALARAVYMRDIRRMPRFEETLFDRKAYLLRPSRHALYSGADHVIILNELGGFFYSYDLHFLFSFDLISFSCISSAIFLRSRRSTFPVFDFGNSSRTTTLSGIFIVAIFPLQ